MYVYALLLKKLRFLVFTLKTSKESPHWASHMVPLGKISLSLTNKCVVKRRVYVQSSYSSVGSDPSSTTGHSIDHALTMLTLS